MKEKQFQELIESIRHVGEYMRGRRKPSRVLKNHGRLDIRELRGKVAFSPGYDYKKLREGKETKPVITS